MTPIIAFFAWLRTLLVVPVPESGGLVEQAPTVGVREIFRRFWRYARPYRWWWGLVVLLVLIAPALDTATIWLFKILIDDVLVPRNFELFFLLGAAYLGITVLSGIVGFTDEYVSTWVAERFLLDLRTDLFGHLHELSIGFLDRRKTGDMLTRLTGDVNSIEDLVLSGTLNALSYSFKIVLFTGALFVLSWRLAAVSLIAVPGFWLSARYFSRRIKAASREKRRRSGTIGAVAEESLSNASLVKAYGQERAETERFRRENLGSFAAQMVATRLHALFTPLVDLLEIGGVLLIVGWALGNWPRARSA
jgi:ABC-type multidrug transport system fused ATPase/permease subunit